MVAYIGLFIISPILNSFIERSTKKKIETFLISFYCFQTIWGWIWNVDGFNGGLSMLPFIGLYILGRYLHNYKDQLSIFTAKNYFNIYIGICLIGAAIMFVCSINNISIVRLVRHTSPLAVCGAAVLLLCFSKINIQNSFINKIAASVFAVYLLHDGPYTFPILKNLIHNIYYSNSFLLSIIKILCVALAIFVVAILVDQLRIIIWRGLCILVDSSRKIITRDNTAREKSK